MLLKKNECFHQWMMIAALSKFITEASGIDSSQFFSVFLSNSVSQRYNYAYRRYQ